MYINFSNHSFIILDVFIDLFGQWSRNSFQAQVYGAISEFVFDAENFTEWIERLEQWFIANDVTQAAKKRAVLLSNIGARGYKLIRSLSQNDPTSRSYADLKRLMLEHLC